jgi:Cdc6-like AAA superfamily ATPase
LAQHTKAGFTSGRGAVCDHFLVLGTWGIGKSTLLREYKRICQARGDVAAIVPVSSFDANATLLESSRAIVEGILRDLPFDFNRLRKVGLFFNQVGITVLGTGISFTRKAAELTPQAFLHDILLKLWHDVQSSSQTLTILLDDIDNLVGLPQAVMMLRQTLSMASIVRQTRMLAGLACTPKSWQGLTDNQVV